MQQITTAQARQKYHYDAITGELFSKKKDGRLKPVGFKRCDGFVIVTVGGQKIYAHKLAYLIHTGKQPGRLTHINGDKSDNRFENIAEYVGAVKSTKAESLKQKKSKRLFQGDVIGHIKSERWLTISITLCKNGYNWFLFKDMDRNIKNGWNCFKLIRQDKAEGRAIYWLYHNKEKDYWCHTKDKKVLKKNNKELHEEIISIIQNN